MKRQVPTEREMTDMIASAYERVAEPDARRLTAIEERLLEQPRLRRRSKIAWWWLAAALAASAASALWWAVDYDSGKGQEQSVPAVTPSSVAPSVADQSGGRPNQFERTELKPAGDPAQKKGPMIYRKEQ